MYKSKLYIPIGISGQGKSTYSEKIKDVDPGVCVISSDQIRKELFGKGYKYNSKDNEIVFAVMNERTREKLMDGYSVYYDATNLEEKYRGQLIHEMLFYSNKIVGLYFPVDLELALRRNEDRESDYVPVSVIERMAKIIDRPKIKEGFDEMRLVLR